MKFIDAFLNNITMYRLTLYYLIVLVGAAVVMSFFGIMQQNPLDILLAAMTAIIVCYISNKVFAYFFHAVTNTESALITALIITLIFPITFPVGIFLIAFASGLAMGSKYFLTIDKRHVFNPAAVAAGAIGLLSAEHSATWWVGTQAMLPFVIIGGLLVVRKIQRETLVTTFLASYLGFLTIISLLQNGSLSRVLESWQLGVLHSALFFFVFVMLTEPLTSPGRKTLRQWYAVIIAAFYVSPQISFLSFVLTPELALCAGNIFSYFVNPNYRLLLTLQEKILVAKDTMLFIFKPTQQFAFIPGQYMEWTLPHANVDDRGNRRYFSIASAPTEQSLMFSIKLYDPPSSYKAMLKKMNVGDHMIASSLAGDFVMTKDTTKPLVFIAGGIGIAPFRAMLQTMIDRKEKRDIIVLYSNRQVQDIAFADILHKAEAFGVRTEYILTDKSLVPADWNGQVGYISTEMIERLIPDYKRRSFYISGPQLMVEQIEEMLHKLQLSKKQIVTDYFPGY